MLVAQSCPTLCDPMDCSLPGPSVHEIFQARILEWVAISFSRGSSQPGDLNPGLLCCRQILYCLKKNLPANAGDVNWGFDPWMGKIPWRREWKPTLVSLPGKYQGQRSLVSCSPWGCKESGTTEQITLFSYPKWNWFFPLLWRSHFSPLPWLVEEVLKCNPLSTCTILFK